MDTIKTKDGFIMIEKNLNGSYVIKNGNFKKIYYGYSKKNALRLFKKEFKKENVTLFIPHQSKSEIEKIKAEAHARRANYGY